MMKVNDPPALGVPLIVPSVASDKPVAAFPTTGRRYRRISTHRGKGLIVGDTLGCRSASVFGCTASEKVPTLVV